MSPSRERGVFCRSMATRKRSTATGVPPAATKSKPPPKLKPKPKAGASANGRARGPAAARGPAPGGGRQGAGTDPVATIPILAQVAPTADLLQRAVEEAASLLQADGAIIYLLDPADGVLRFAHDAGIDDLHGRRWVRRLELRPGQGMFGRAVAERRVVVTRDYPNDDSFPHAEATDRFVREVGLRSMIVAPLVAGDRVFGALGAFSLRAGAFDAAQTGLVRSLADHAGGAMANALLIEELAGSRAEIERRADAERTVREIAARITAMRDADEILQYVTAAATRLLRATGGMMDLVGTPSAGMAWARSSDPAHPVDTSQLDATELELDAGVSGLALRTGQAQSTGDYLADTRFEHRATRDAFVRENGIHSVIVAPLLIAGEVAGAITVYDKAVDAFSENDGLVLQALADQASVTITNARLIEQLEQSAAEIRRRAEAERTLREMAARIAELREADDLLPRIVEESRRLLGSDGAHLTRMSDDETYVVPVVVSGRHRPGRHRGWLKQMKFPVVAGINGLAAASAEWRSGRRLHRGRAHPAGGWTISTRPTGLACAGWPRRHCAAGGPDHRHAGCLVRRAP